MTLAWYFLSLEGLRTMVTVVTGFDAVGLAVSEKKSGNHAANIEESTKTPSFRLRLLEKRELLGRWIKRYS